MWDKWKELGHSHRVVRCHWTKVCSFMLFQQRPTLCQVISNLHSPNWVKCQLIRNQPTPSAGFYNCIRDQLKKLPSDQRVGTAGLCCRGELCLSETTKLGKEDHEDSHGFLEIFGLFKRAHYSSLWLMWFMCAIWHDFEVNTFPGTEPHTHLLLRS